MDEDFFGIVEQLQGRLSRKCQRCAGVGTVLNLFDLTSPKRELVCEDCRGFGVVFNR